MLASEEPTMTTQPDSSGRPGITLYHHPFTRAATVVWMLEELGLREGTDYALVFVDLKQASPAAEAVRTLNPMAKLPTLVDGSAVATETAAIGMYLADRYSAGQLAPALDDPGRATYLRWTLFGPSVIEPAAATHASGWEVNPGSVGWGSWERMLAATRAAIGAGPWLLGERFTMADVCFGATLRFMVGFQMLPQDPVFVGYIERLSARPAAQRAAVINQRVIQEQGLGG
jgi:glutathione S-transferase